jgi:molybdopterin-guanine dinucleotide biosynthesis protein A
MTLQADVAGVILTGGRSRRMGGVVKAHKPLAGIPLIQHVINRIQPQVSRLTLSVEHIRADYDCYGLKQIADPRPGSCGPLGGLQAAMAELDAKVEWLLLVPCDAPFLPLDLAIHLRTQALDSFMEAAVVSYQSELQPTFSIWNRSLLPALSASVLEQGMGGFKQFIDHHPVAVLDWKYSDISPFFNINDSGKMAEANLILEQKLVI